MVCGGDGGCETAERGWDHGRRRRDRELHYYALLETLGWIWRKTELIRTRRIWAASAADSSCGSFGSLDPLVCVAMADLWIWLGSSRGG